MLLKLLDLIALHEDDLIFLVNFLQVFDLLIVCKQKRAFKLCVKLSNFLVDAKQHFLLPHDLDWLDTVDVFFAMGCESGAIVSWLGAIFLAWNTFVLASNFALIFELGPLILGWCLVFFLSNCKAEIGGFVRVVSWSFAFLTFSFIRQGGWSQILENVFCGCWVIWRWILKLTVTLH